jgi:biopolymer transport protein ExbB/TolQ
MITLTSSLFFADVLYAFDSSNPAAKGIIILLAIGSVFSWSVMWTKYQSIKSAQIATQKFLTRFRNSRHPLEVFEIAKKYSPSPLSAIYFKGSRELCFHLLGSSEVDETFHGRLASSGKVKGISMSSVRSAMEQCVGEEALRLESQLILLASAVSGAPFLGLLGTVWGVMDAFTGVAQAGTPNLAVLAPGVSGALLTTVVGLLVAIPAMFGYNYIVTTIKGMTVEMENFAAECASAFEHRYLEIK